MYDSIILVDSFIEFINIDKYDEFTQKLNYTNKFLTFFEKIKINGLIKKNDIHKLNINFDEYHTILLDDIEQLIININNLCKKYGQFLSLKLKIVDDGEFLMYIIIKKNKINDIADKINKYITIQEKKLWIKQKIKKNILNLF